jgi:hypothetical protein
MAVPIHLPADFDLSVVEIVEPDVCPCERKQL